MTDGPQAKERGNRMTKPRKKNEKAVHISLNPKPKGDFKRLGGSMADD